MEYKNVSCEPQTDWQTQMQNKMLTNDRYIHCNMEIKNISTFGHIHSMLHSSSTTMWCVGMFLANWEIWFSCVEFDQLTSISWK